MTDNQFQQLFAAQLAQIALLQAIEVNVSFMAHKARADRENSSQLEKSA